jgi:hypothetical protein
MRRPVRLINVFSATSPHYGIDSHHTPITQCAATPIPLPPFLSKEEGFHIDENSRTSHLMTNPSLQWHRRPPHPNDTIHSRSHCLPSLNWGDSTSIRVVTNRNSTGIDPDAASWLTSSCVRQDDLMKTLHVTRRNVPPVLVCFVHCIWICLSELTELRCPDWFWGFLIVIADRSPHNSEIMQSEQSSCNFDNPFLDS